MNIQKGEHVMCNVKTIPALDMGKYFAVLEQEHPAEYKCVEIFRFPHKKIKHANRYWCLETAESSAN